MTRALGPIGCILALAVLATTGCVRRTLTIKTDPQGASVFLNDQQVGTTPVSVDFTWYGDYDIIIRHPERQTLQTHAKIDPPWYQIPPVDFLAEALTPWTYHDQRELFYTLDPLQPIPHDQLLKQAQDFRDRTLFGNQ